MTAIQYRILTTIEEMKAVVELQQEIWPGVDGVPDHLLLTAANNGGLVIGAYDDTKLIGFVFGFLGFEHISETEAEIKHSSHMVGVIPAYRHQKIGFGLKQAQWQILKRQNIKLATWTFDPLEAKNAYLNIARLGGVVRKYSPNLYGTMQDDLNAGIPSDRMTVEWGIGSARVEKRILNKDPLTAKHYEDGGITAINQVTINAAGYASPTSDQMNLIEDPQQRPAMTMLQIPSNFQAMRKDDPELALTWRMYTRTLFELFFQHGYLITDFIFKSGEQSTGYYIFSQEAALNRAANGGQP